MTIAPQTYISQSLKTAQMITCPQECDSRYPEVDLNSDILQEVDAILFSSEPFLFKESHLDEFADTYNVARDKLHIIDGEMTSWYGSRVIPGLKYLANYAKEL